MTYIEMQFFEDAVLQFLTQLKRKKRVEIQYHWKATKQARRQDFAFTGFETNAGGLHGLHYTPFPNTYYFGTFGEDTGRKLNICYASLEQRIPSKLKDAMIKVCLARASITLDLSQP